jgi:hypothetical protein
VQQPGAVHERRIDPLEPLRSCAREPGDAARVAVEPRRLQIRSVAERRQRHVEGFVVGERAPRLRLGLDSRRPQVVGIRDLEQLGRRLGEDRRDGWIKRPPRPAGNCLRRDLGAADRVEHHRSEADRREPRRLRNLVAAPTGRRAATVVALEGIEDRTTYLLRQPQTACQVGADLAVCARPLRDELGDTGGAAQHP